LKLLPKSTEQSKDRIGPHFIMAHSTETPD
jgi:hypothetical protein